MTLDPTTERLLSAAMLRLRARAPFFATLALFARFQSAGQDMVATTDGRDVFVNPALLHTLSAGERDAALLHAVLHAALLHVPRRGARDREVWNLAADVVVNGMIAGAGIALPADAVRMPDLEQLSVEEVYELLQFSPERQPPLPGLDLMSSAVAGGAGDRSGSDGSEGGSMTSGQQAALEEYWRNAMQQAQVVALAAERGSLPSGAAREVAMTGPARLDWRAHLWRYLVQTPTDFQGYDRRFVGRGLYLEALEGESLHVYVAVDTSGSIHVEQVRALVSEVQAILGAYPHLRCDLYYADDKAYGPFALGPADAIPTPVGGGGTDFRPFFDALEVRRAPYESGVCVYLTDGYGQFPPAPPDLPVLWVVTPGGLDTEAFPFGEVVRLLVAT